MSRAVEPGRSLGRDSSQGFVENVREGREDVLLKDLIAPLDSMPPVEFALAYGSGVFTQALHTCARSNEVCVCEFSKPVSSLWIFEFFDVLGYGLWWRMVTLWMV